MAKTPFLAGLHRQFGLTRSQVVDIAMRAADRRVETVERLARGYDNEVHRVTFTTGLVVFVRIRRHGEGTLEQEVWAMGLACARRVPAPDVLAADGACDAAEGRPVMVVAAANGRQLAEVLPNLHEEERGQILSNLGEVLALLHSIEVSGVWRPGDDGQWPDPEGLRAGFARDRRGERDLLVAAGMRSAEVDRVMALLEISPDPPRSGFVLCHGAISTEHVFVDSEDRISGLIDWGMWHGGSRMGELAYVATTFGWGSLQSILPGYRHSLAGEGDELTRQLSIMLVVQLIGHIAHHVRIGDIDGAARNVAAVRQALGLIDGDLAT